MLFNLLSFIEMGLKNINILKMKYLGLFNIMTNHILILFSIEILMVLNTDTREKTFPEMSERCNSS